jgi:uncharacterized membrane protein YhiD involved in acid resistance
MSKPEFTADEQFLVNYVKSTKAVSSSGNYMWGYVSGAILVAGCGFYYESIYVMAIAFVVLIGFRIHEERLHQQWQPLWKSIILKYEATLETVQKQASADAEL